MAEQQYKLERQQMNVVNISKRTLLQQYIYITDENLTEKEVHIKSGTKKSFKPEERSILIAQDLSTESSTLRKRRMFRLVHFILISRIM